MYNYLPKNEFDNMPKNNQKNDSNNQNGQTTPTLKKPKGNHKAKYPNVKAKHEPLPKKHKYQYTFGNPSDLAYEEKIAWQTTLHHKNALKKDKTVEKNKKKVPTKKKASRRELYLRLNKNFEVGKDVAKEKEMWAKIRASKEKTPIIKQENNLPPHNDNSLALPTNELKEIKEDIPDTDSPPIIEEKELKEEKSGIELSQITAQDKADFMSFMSKIEKHYGNYDKIPPKKLLNLILEQGYDATYLELLRKPTTTNTTKGSTKELNVPNDDTLVEFMQFISLLESTYRVSYDQIPPPELKKMIVKEGFDPRYLKYLATSKGNDKQKQSKKHKPQYTGDEIKAATAYPEDIEKFKKFAQSMHKNSIFKDKDLKNQVEDMYAFGDNIPDFISQNSLSSIDSFEETKKDINQEIKEVKKDKIDLINNDQATDQVSDNVLDGLTPKQQLDWINTLLIDNPGPSAFAHIVSVLLEAYRLGKPLQKLIEAKASKNTFYKLLASAWKKPGLFVEISELSARIGLIENNEDKTQVKEISDLSRIKSLISKLGLSNQDLDELIQVDAPEDNPDVISLKLSFDPTNQELQNKFWGKIYEMSMSQNEIGKDLDFQFIIQNNLLGHLFAQPNANKYEEQAFFAQYLAHKKYKVGVEFLKKQDKIAEDGGDFDLDDLNEGKNSAHQYVKQTHAAPKKKELALLTFRKILNSPLQRVDTLLDPLKNALGKNWHHLLTPNPGYQKSLKLLYDLFASHRGLEKLFSPKFFKVKNALIDPELLSLIQLASDEGVGPVHYQADGGRSKKYTKITSKQSLINNIKVGKEVAKVQSLAPRLTVAYAFNPDTQTFEFDPSIPPKLAAYYQSLPDETHRELFKDISRKVALQLKASQDPSRYFNSVLKGKIRNMILFESKALTQLEQNFSKGNTDNKPLCVILHTHRSAEAFVHDPYLTKVITNPKLFTIVLDGRANLAAYGKEITDVAQKYGGKNKKIDQLMVVAHGQRNYVGLVNHEEFTTGSEELKKFLDVLFKNMDKKVPENGTDKQPHRRILLNACHTGEATLVTEQALLNVSPIERKVFLKDYYEQNINLREFIENYAKEKGADIQHVIGGNQPTTFDKLIDENTGGLTLADRFLDNKALKQGKMETLKYALQHNYDPKDLPAYILEAYGRDEFDWQAIIKARINNANSLKGQKTKPKKNYKNFVDKGVFDKSLKILLTEPFDPMKVYEFSQFIQAKFPRSH